MSDMRRNRSRKMNNRRKQQLKKNQHKKQFASILSCMILLLITVGVLRLITAVVIKYVPMEDTTVEAEEPKNEVIVSESAMTVSEPAIAEEPVQEQPTLKVCIDAGHGGKDGGSPNASQTRFEKDDTLNISLKLRDYLTSKGVEVVMTRDTDVYVTLQDRCQIANDAGATYFVSLHRNQGEANGMEIWISHNASEATTTLTNNINEALINVGVSRERGVRTGSSTSEEEDYYVTCHTAMPSCIVELGFMNSDQDNQLFDEHIDDYAQAIGDAIIKSAGESQPSAGEGGMEETDSSSASESGASQGYALQNEQISLDGLSTELLNWGSGGDKDEMGRPVGANMYQEQYGKYNAYFVFNQSDDKVIYLTSDEGYENGMTPDILDTLKEKNVKITFFVTMDFARDNGDLVQRMIDEGHIIGNHSLTHPSEGVCALSLEDQTKEVMDVHNYVRDTFNYNMYLFRYPSGKFSEQSIALLNNLNYKSVFWSFAYADYDINNQPDPATSLENCLNNLHPGAIYLLHAVSSTNRDILADFIDGARAQGYEFASLSPDM